MGDRDDDNDYIWLSNSPTYGFSFRNTQGQSTNWTDASLLAGFQQWGHYLLTADGQGSLNLYFNGVHQGVKTADTSFEINTIGNAFASQNLSFKGSIDDVAIFNQALDSSHALSLYRNGNPQDISNGLALAPLVYEGILTATNAVGSVETPIKINVVPAPQVTTFKANHGGFTYGDSPSTELSWEILHAEKAYFDGKEVPTKGSVFVSPDPHGPTTYTITATTALGSLIDSPIVSMGPVYTIGPFNATGVFNISHGPENNPVDLSDTFNEGNTELAWVEKVDWVDGVNMNLPAGADNANYIFRTLSVTAPRTLRLNVFTDDGVKVWLNQELVYQNSSRGTHTPSLQIPQGESQLLIKVHDIGGNHYINFNSDAIPGYQSKFSFTVAPYNLELTNIGRSESLGQLDFDPDKDSYDLSGNGTSISSGSDRFLFGSSKLIGDGQVSVRVNSLSAPGSNAMAGLHMRSSLSRNEPSASILLRSNGSAEFRMRPEFRNGYNYTHSEPAITAPYFLRLVRVGDDFSGFVSKDSSSWVEIARWTSLMPPSIDVGLFILSGSSSETANATFDNFQQVEFNSHGLKGLWRFNEGSSGTSQDYSVYGQDAEISDATFFMTPTVVLL